MTVVDWPPQSPDMNPVEKVWLWLSNKIYLKEIKNIDDLRKTVFESWEEMSNLTVLSFIEKLDDIKYYIEKNDGKLYSKEKDRK